ncbi:hypothetical protein ACTXPS_15220 [Brachybacterium tyrofermentans]|uniref:hypothetical protein n=1 Tax=Brachybacterium tyrofermentans TaxID=47848 RepID=UPI003FD375E5
MNSHELTDRDGDALTVTTHNGQAWITCTSGPVEVTIGPLPVATMGAAFAETWPEDNTDTED